MQDEHGLFPSQEDVIETFLHFGRASGCNEPFQVEKAVNCMKIQKQLQLCDLLYHNIPLPKVLCDLITNYDGTPFTNDEQHFISLGCLRVIFEMIESKEASLKTTSRKTSRKTSKRKRT